MKMDKDFKKQVAKEGKQSAVVTFNALSAKPIPCKNKKQLVKFTFTKVGRDKENKFQMFEPLNDYSQIKSYKELVAFDKEYIIEWYEKNEAFNGREWVSKTIQTIKDNDGSVSNNQPQQQSTPVKQQNSTTPSNEIDYMNESIARKYIQACVKKGIKPTVLAYTGKMVEMNSPKDEWKEYKDWFNSLVTENELGADTNTRASKEPSEDMKKALNQNDSKTRSEDLSSSSKVMAKDVLKKENVLGLIKARDSPEGLMYDDLDKALKESFIFVENELNQFLTELIDKDGNVFETRPGYYKVLE